jgi:hypothetical protein
LANGDDGSPHGEAVSGNKVNAPGAPFTSLKPVLRAPRVEREAPLSEPPLEIDPRELASIPPAPVSDLDWEVTAEPPVSIPPDPVPISMEELEILSASAAAEEISLLLAPPPLFAPSHNAAPPPHLPDLAYVPVVAPLRIPERRTLVSRRLWIALGAAAVCVASASLTLVHRPSPEAKTPLSAIAESPPKAPDAPLALEPDPTEVAAVPPPVPAAPLPPPVPDAPLPPPVATTAPRVTTGVEVGAARIRQANVGAGTPAAPTRAPPPARRPTAARDQEPPAPPALPLAAPATPWSSGAPGTADFNPQEAMRALRQAADRAVTCRTAEAATGSSRVAVTFGPSGRAVDAVLEGPLFVGTPIGACIVASFRGVRITPFSGSNVTVRRTILF